MMYRRTSMSSPTASRKMRYQLTDIVMLVLVMMMTVWAGALGTSSQLAESEPYQYQDQCQAIFHRIEVEEDGCTGDYPALSCYGRCRSTSVPLFYKRKGDLINPASTKEKFVHEGNCCTATVNKYDVISVPLICENGTNITVQKEAKTATHCACTPL